jgi:hypothetical protein
VQEREIESLRVNLEVARRSRNKRLMGQLRKRIDHVVRLRDTYKRMLARES